MPISEYLRGLRSKVGHDLLLVPSVTGLIFDGEGRLLLLKHSNGGVWVAPGGAIDPDERPRDAVVREVLEETGLRVDPVSLLGVFGGPDFRVHYANGDEIAYVMTVFECRVITGDLRPDGDEVLEAKPRSEILTSPVGREASCRGYWMRTAGKAPHPPAVRSTFALLW